MKRENNLKKTNWLTIPGCFLIIVAFVLLVWFLLRGETKITGEWSEYTSESLRCYADDKPYFLYNPNGVLSSYTQVNILFNNDLVKTISLIHKTTYGDSKTSKVQSDAMEFAINDNFGKNDLKPYSLSATFSNKDNRAQFSLYANVDDINQTTSKYFMLENLPDGINNYQKYYQSLGFICETMK